jgi:hypothetical protein
LENRAWIESVRTGTYRDWIEKNYADRMTVNGGR